MPLLPNHILTLKWGHQADSSPLEISNMHLSWGSVIYPSQINIGGPYQIQNNVISLQGPENRIVFNRWLEDEIDLQLSGVENQKIEAYWDGFPVEIRTGSTTVQISLPAYKWGNSIWYKRALFLMGILADYLVAALILFPFFFFLLVLLINKNSGLVYMKDSFMEKVMLGTWRCITIIFQS